MRDLYRRAIGLVEWEREVNENRKREGGFAPFFPLNKVPKSHHSRSFQTLAGDTRTAATVDDVFRWARTGRGGQQYVIDFDDLEEPPTCSSRSGLCE